MLLDEYLRVTISKKISEILPIILKNVKEKPFDKTTLNYQNYADFLYGEIIGFLNGYLAGIVTTLYGINLEPGIFDEIHQITENYAQEIRNNISKMNLS
ncbi:MAG: hypothetical protein HYS75_04150 [Nitrosopumilales archaeon]|nr:hypothetical protein [Nitrosopumilales archaeon]